MVLVGCVGTLRVLVGGVDVRRWRCCVSGDVGGAGGAVEVAAIVGWRGSRRCRWVLLML